MTQFSSCLRWGMTTGLHGTESAPNSPVTHALVLGVIGLVVCALAAVATWNAGPAFGPAWYPLALAVTALPSNWLGGRIYLQQISRNIRDAN